MIIIIINYQVFEIGSCQWVDVFWVSGLVGRWVSGWWSACHWSVDLIKPEYINMTSTAKLKGHKKYI